MTKRAILLASRVAAACAMCIGLTFAQAAAQSLSDLPAASSGSLTDIIPCTQGSTGPGTGTTNKCTTATILNTPGSSVYVAATQIHSGSSLLALEYSNAAGTPVKIEIFPDATAKPDEGNASVAGTVAWAAAQLTGGGEIFVHNGAYTIDTTVTLSAQGTELVCADNKETIFTAANSFNSIMFKLGWAGAQRQGMAIRDCGFNGNLSSNTSGTIVWARDTAYSNIVDNNMEFAGKNALILDATVAGAVNNTIRDNILYECTEECFVINGEGGASNTTDNFVQGNSIGGTLYGDGTKPMVSISGPGSLQWVQNHVWGQASANYHTDCMDFLSNEAQVTIIGSEIESCSQYGINLGASSPYQFSITGNLFYDNGAGTTNTYADVDLNTGSDVTITGNTFLANSTAKYGVFSSQGGTSNIISNNVFNGYSGDGISLLNMYQTGVVIGMNAYPSSSGTYVLGAGASTPATVTAESGSGGPNSNITSLSNLISMQLSSGYTVAALAAAIPCSSTTLGTIARVTDANSPTLNGTLTGGGTGAAANVLALCNGTNWVAQ